MDATIQWYSNFYHDYSTASLDLLNQLNGDTTGGKQILFLQPLAGTKILFVSQIYRIIFKANV